MASSSLLAKWFPEHKPKASSMRNASVFYRNLEETLDLRRAERNLYTIKSNPPPESIDFTSLDFLGLSANGVIRKPFLEELAKEPNFTCSSGGSQAAEAEIAVFHSSETAVLFHSGFEANCAIMTAIPWPGDAIVYDELIHASMLEGMNSSLALCKMSFKHNDVDSFRETLLNVRETQLLIKQGKRCVLICVESLYSMDGDVCPLRELVAVAKEVFPDGNAQFIVDEAHSTGVLGRQGRGFVNELGMEEEVAIRMHTFGKGLAVAGSAVVCKVTVRDMLLNYSKSLICSVALPFPMIAAIRVAYRLMMTGQTQPLQDRLQRLVKHFLQKITTHEVWDEATEEGILSIPVTEDWEAQPFVTHVVSVVTRPRYLWFLGYHVQLAGLSAFPIEYPIVPKGRGRLRLVFHAHNTEEEVERLVEAICEWAREMLDIEASESEKGKVPRAAQQVYAFQAAAAAVKRTVEI